MGTSSLRKAAVVLLSLPSVQRSRLLGKLDAAQSAVVAEELNALSGVSETEQDAVAAEFAAARLGESRQHPAAPFQFLHGLGAAEILDLIADEQPQTIALILCQLPPRQAAGVLAELTPEGQISITGRIAAMNDTSPETIRDVEQALSRRLYGPTTQSTGNRRLAGVVRILNVMEPASERRLLSMLAKTAPELAHEIRLAMFGPDVGRREGWQTADAAG
jgi:flagellar motor switch protein FliG